MRILFAATGEIAVPTLEALHRKNLISAVLCSPDEPGKRGSALIAPPTKVKALELGLPVLQPEHLGSEARRLLAEYDLDTLVSFCYGKIFGPKFLALFKDAFNIHPSLLPKYRGCAPIYETIRNMDRVCGISIQKIALEVDSGDIMNSFGFPLDGRESQNTLSEKVALLAADLAVSTFCDISSYPPRPQTGEASFSSFIKKEDGILDFHKPARILHAQIRACYPWPKARTVFQGKNLFITGVYGSVFDSFEPSSEEPGTVVGYEKGKGLKIATSDGYLYASRLQAEAKKEMDAGAFVNGNKAVLSAKLGE